MSVTVKLPYNFNYQNELTDYLFVHKELISSIYFGFFNGSRPIKKDTDSIESHLKKLEKIKDKLNIKLNYVLNSVIPIDLDEKDLFVLSSGIVDTVTVSRDDTYEKVEAIRQKFNYPIEYEVSRFYDYIEDNTGQLKNIANIFIYGFEHEFPERKRDEKNVYCFIVNERCYPGCNQKIMHNKNVVLRNLAKTTFKFSCPYKDKRRLYLFEEISRICKEYKVNLLKFCDRTMDDRELLELFNLWFPYITEKI